MGIYHTVEQGECLSSLAKQFGHLDFHTIYDHPENVEFKKLRPNPNIIFPGDEVYVPEFEVKEVDAATEQLHEFVLDSNKTLFRLILKDSDENVFADLPYDLRIGETLLEGRSDSGGRIEREIPADARLGTVILYRDGAKTDAVAIIPLNFGYLDPVEEFTGIQSRLNNLGFGCGKVDGKIGPKTKAALADFQRKHGLSDTGEPDQMTKSALEQEHEWH